MSNRVALIGAGAMGGAIGTRLAGTGNRLTVFDPSPEKRQALVDRAPMPHRARRKRLQGATTSSSASTRRPSCARPSSVRRASRKAQGPAR